MRGSISERVRYVRNVFARPKRSVTASVHVRAAHAVPVRSAPESTAKKALRYAQLFTITCHARLNAHHREGAFGMNREQRYARLRMWHQFWTLLMILALAMIIVGIPVAIWMRSIGMGLIVYGGFICVLGSSFYFIVRTRYNKAKLAHDARAHAERLTQR